MRARTSSPKSHCEIDGVGIEYSWGKSKAHFRKHNDCEPSNLHARNIVASHSLDVLPLGRRIRKFARRTREYKRAYKVLKDWGETMNQANLEKIVKESKRHRNAADFDSGFIDRA